MNRNRSSYLVPRAKSFTSFVVLVAATLIWLQALANSTPPKNNNHTEGSFFRVSGGVQRPGRYEWHKGLTVLGAIKIAGGFTKTAGNKIQIVHTNGVTELYVRGGTNAPTEVEKGDLIAVPKKLL